MKLNVIPADTTKQPYATFFKSFQDLGLRVPVPLQLMTASPPLFENYTKMLMHYINHETLSPKLLACIRYTVAYRNDFSACIEMNQNLLKIHAITDLAPLQKEIPHPDLSETESIIYRVAIDIIFYPEQIHRTRIEELATKGISEQLLFEAAYHGALLLMMGPLVKALS